MNHDIYIFGSAVRGEISSSSDIDVLAVPLGNCRRDYPSSWSVYSPEIIQSYFRTGRLFAWHLHLEAKCIYSVSATPFLAELGVPASYSSAHTDIDDLEGMLHDSLLEIEAGTNNLIFELGIAYTAIRDIAMAASWKMMGRPCFSRRAPYMLPVICPLPVDVYSGAMLARHSSTRGIDLDINATHIAKELLLSPVLHWVNEIRNRV